MVADWGAVQGLAGINLVRCCQCGQPCRGGATDYLGRFRCEDCARAMEAVEQSRRRQQVAAQEADRLAAVVAEDHERSVMWGLPALDAL